MSCDVSKFDIKALNLNLYVPQNYWNYYANFFESHSKNKNCHIIKQKISWLVVVIQSFPTIIKLILFSFKTLFSSHINLRINHMNQSYESIIWINHTNESYHLTFCETGLYLLPEQQFPENPLCFLSPFFIEFEFIVSSFTVFAPAIPSSFFR